MTTMTTTTISIIIWAAYIDAHPDTIYERAERAHRLNDVMEWGGAGDSPAEAAKRMGARALALLPGGVLMCELSDRLYVVCAACEACGGSPWAAEVATQEDLAAYADRLSCAGAS